MNASIFGCGYVGSVSPACLARDGHGVHGVDDQPAKPGLIGEVFGKALHTFGLRRRLQACTGAALALLVLLAAQSKSGVLA